MNFDTKIAEKVSRWSTHMTTMLRLTLLLLIMFAYQGIVLANVISEHYGYDVNEVFTDYQEHIYDRQLNPRGYAGYYLVTASRRLTGQGSLFSFFDGLFVTKGAGKENGILRDAAKGKGNFGLGSGSRSEADKLGKAWVGDGYKVASDNKTLISSWRSYATVFSPEAIIHLETG